MSYDDCFGKKGILLNVKMFIAYFIVPLKSIFYHDLFFLKFLKKQYGLPGKQSSAFI
jgi:hypothetical protein